MIGRGLRFGLALLVCHMALCCPLAAQELDVTVVIVEDEPKSDSADKAATNNTPPTGNTPPEGDKVAPTQETSKSEALPPQKDTTPQSDKAPEDDGPLMREVDALVETQQFDAAYRKIITLKSYTQGNLETRLKAGRIASWAKRFGDAHEVFNAVLAAEPGNVEALLGKARTYAWNERYEYAEHIYRRVLDAHPDNLEAGMGMVDVLFWMQRYHDAQTALAPFLVTHADHPDVLRHQQRIEAQLQPRVESPPPPSVQPQPLVDTRDFLGQINARIAQNDFDGALALIDTAPPEQRDHAEVRAKRPFLLFWLGREAEAEAAFRAELKRTPEQVDMLIGLARIARNRGHWYKAIELGTRAFKLAPASRDAALVLGKAYVAVNRFQRAREVYDQALVRHPDDAELLVARAEILVAEGKHREARRRHDELTAGRPGMTRETREIFDRLLPPLRNFASARYEYDEVRNDPHRVRYDLALFLRPWRSFGIGGEYADIRIFGGHDQVITGSTLVQPWVPTDLYLECEYSANLEPTVLWDHRVALGLAYRFDSGTTASLRWAQMNYVSKNADLFVAGIEQALDEHVTASYRAFYGTDIDKASSLSHEFRFGWTTDSRYSLAASYIYGQEGFEFSGSGERSSAEVHGISLQSRLWFSEDFSLRLEAHNEWRSKHWYRRGIMTGLEFDF